ncbi:MAG: MaoC/PaaZ C-terminal domain-containing protein [Pseudomonadales bacterium]|nr:MaoC/PaaZ C-terminal domain-containing protein [Pseudomonadales bacterium]
MPLDKKMIGCQTDGVEHWVDERWLMAYAASLADLNPVYMDTSAGNVIAHPIFPVCLEWPPILNTRKLAAADTLTDEESGRGVHAAHDLHIFRPISAGETLTTKATMIGIEAIKPGGAYTMRLDTFDAQQQLVCATYQLSIYRGVAVIDGRTGNEGDGERAPEAPVSLPIELAQNFDIHIPASLAHTYTECARIWNPIHTDRKVALAAGLPDIILHGTATLALAVTRIIDERLGGDPTRVKRIGGRFATMVLMPSTIQLQLSASGDNHLSFQVLNEQGETAISKGFICFD